MIFSFKLALRFLNSGRSQTFLIVAGISIAIAVQVFIGLLMGSLQKNFVDRTLGSSADITIESSVKGSPLIYDWNSIVATLQQIDSVKAASVVAAGSAFIESDVTAYVRGFVLEEVDRMQTHHKKHFFLRELFHLP